MDVYCLFLNLLTSFFLNSKYFGYSYYFSIEIDLLQYISLSVGLFINDDFTWSFFYPKLSLIVCEITGRNYKNQVKMIRRLRKIRRKTNTRRAEVKVPIILLCWQIACLTGIWLFIIYQTIQCMWMKNAELCMNVWQRS